MIEKGGSRSSVSDRTARNRQKPAATNCKFPNFLQLFQIRNMGTNVGTDWHFGAKVSELKEKLFSWEPSVSVSYAA
jgi:hypothetical protein